MDEIKRESCRRLYELLENNDTNITEFDIYNSVQICKYYQKMNSNVNDASSILIDDLKAYTDFVDGYETAIGVLNEKLKKLISQRLMEVYLFCKSQNDSTLTFYKELLFYKYLPFKDANIEMERLIFSILYNDNKIKNNYNELISALAFTIYDCKLFGGLTINNIEKIDSFLFNDKINYSFFRNKYKFYNQYKASKLKLYPSDEKIRSNIINMKTRDNDIISNYAELVVYEEQKKLIQDSRPELVDKIVWVSRDYGEGFGYDILSVNPTNNREVLIKVDGIDKKEKCNSFYLTNKENDILNSIYNKPEDLRDTDYYIYQVYMQNDKIIDIYKITVSTDENNNLTFIDQLGNYYNQYADINNRKVESYKRKYLFKK